MLTLLKNNHANIADKNDSKLMHLNPSKDQLLIPLKTIVIYQSFKQK